MKPVVDRLEQLQKGKVEFRIVNIDTAGQAEQKLADSFGVIYVPTFVLLNRDGSRADQIVGEVSEADLARKLASLK